MSAAAPENPLLHGRRSSATIPPKLSLAHQSSASTITTSTNNTSGSSSLTNSAIPPRKSSLPDQKSASTIATATNTSGSSSLTNSATLTPKLNYLVYQSLSASTNTSGSSSHESLLASTITTSNTASSLLTNSVMLPRKLSLSDQLSASTITTTTTTTSSSSTSASSSLTNSIADDYELFSIKPVSYTSLRDILPPSSINSPGSEISIRNRLVKQAAWAYLQPMATSPDSSSRSLFGCMFFRFPVNNPVAGVIELFDRCILAPLTRAVDWLLRAIWIRSSR